MRKIGKTTRTVDTAIQHIFGYGGVIVPKQIPFDLTNIHEEHEGFPLSIDDDAEGKSEAQEVLTFLIRERLANEHAGQVTMVANKDYIFFNNSVIIK